MNKLAVVIVLVVCAAGVSRVGAQSVVAVRVTVDTEGASTRLVLTASRNVSASVTESRGKIEILYAEPVDIKPPEGRTGDAILAEWSVRGDRTVVVRTGAGYRSYEAYNLKNPTRLVLDLDGDRPTRAREERGGQETERRFVVVVDPGHGGVEAGAVGPGGVQEKDVTLDLARRLKGILQQDPTFSVVLTRDEDRLVPLYERTAIANNNRADLFLSFHLNSSRRKQAFGAETYFLSPDGTDDEARTVAALENRAYGSVGSPGSGVQTEPGLDLILWDLAQNQYLAESGRLAESIQSEMNLLAGTRNRGVRQAPFSVLMGATMPAVLVEVGFISNPAEATKFQGDEHRNKIVEAVARAITQFRQGVMRFDLPERAVKPLLALLVSASIGCGCGLPAGRSAGPEHAPPAEAVPPVSSELEVPAAPLADENVTLYFPSASTDGLVAEPREILRTTTPGDRAKQILSDLLAGPSDDAAVSLVPAGTRLRQVYILGDTAYADFSEELRTGLDGGSDAELLTVYSIVNSLALNIQEISRVGILVEGRPCESLNGHLDLTHPLKPNKKLLFDARPDAQEEEKKDVVLRRSPLPRLGA